METNWIIPKVKVTIPEQCPCPNHEGQECRYTGCSCPQHRGEHCYPKLGIISINQFAIFKEGA